MCYFISLGIVGTSFSQKWLAIIVKIQSDFLSAEELLFDAIDKQRLQSWSSYGLIAAFSNAIDLLYWDNYRNTIKCQGRGCFCFGIFILMGDILCPTDKIKSQKRFYFWSSICFLEIFKWVTSLLCASAFGCVSSQISSFSALYNSCKGLHTHLVGIIRTKEAWGWGHTMCYYVSAVTSLIL